MDPIDRNILKELQENSRISMAELSNRVSLSRPSTNERVTKLFEKGFIDKFTISIPPEKLGYHVLFYILISDLKVSGDDFLALILDHPNVLEIHFVTGEIHYFIKAATKDIPEMHDLLAMLMPYAQIRTSLVLNSPLASHSRLPL